MHPYSLCAVSTLSLWLAQYPAGWHDEIWPRHKRTAGAKILSLSNSTLGKTEWNREYARLFSSRQRNAERNAIKGEEGKGADARNEERGTRVENNPPPPPLSFPKKLKISLAFAALSRPYGDLRISY